MGYLILVRHGESRWNKLNRFTGWVDVSLSKEGIHEALACANELKDLRIHLAYTSNLRRAQETLLIVLAQQYLTGIFCHASDRNSRKYHFSGEFEKNEIPIHATHYLNERYYGALQGMSKTGARKKYGYEKVVAWRRSFKTRPPKGESLKDVYARAVPYFQRNILSKVVKNNIIISGHGNTLRTIIKYIENISDTDIPHLELPYGQPIIYKYTNKKLARIDFTLSFNRPIVWKDTTIRHA